MTDTKFYLRICCSFWRGGLSIL